MIANLSKEKNGITAQLEHYIPHSVKDVWAMFAEQDKLSSWFTELSVTSLSEGEVIKFDMQDGTFADLKIFSCKKESRLEFDWFGDVVRFEFHAKKEGTLLSFKETIQTITDQTAKDLAGWHVCILVIEALLNGEVIDDRMAIWKPYYDKYVVALSDL